MADDIVNHIYETMKQLQIFTREELENTILSESYNILAEKYIDELLCTPVVQQVFELYRFVG